ncbi:MAG: hypothetical protein V3R29_04045 [Candidatus Acidoferrales bacterium]
MTGKLIVRSILVILLTATLLWAGDPWKAKPYTEWTEKDVEKVLTDSPWARRVEVYSVFYREGVPSMQPPIKPTWVYNPQSGGYHLRWEYPSGNARKVPTVRVEGTFIVRWVSSLSVRQALVRWGQLNRRANEEGLESLAGQPDYYIVSVSPPCESPVLQPARSGQTIQPVRQVLGSDPTISTSAGTSAPLFKKAIEASGKGGQLAVDFYFPRIVNGEPVIEPRERKVRFRCKFGEKTIKADFDLRKMVRDGQPDL